MIKLFLIHDALEAVNPLLVGNYNQPLPRYTSNPTVPFWNDQLEARRFIKLLG